MRNHIQASFAMLLAMTVFALPAMSAQADELVTPETVDLSFLFDFVSDVFDAVWTVVSPSEARTGTPEIGGQIEPVGELEDPSGPGFGGGAEPVG